MNSKQRLLVNWWVPYCLVIALLTLTGCELRCIPYTPGRSSRELKALEKQAATQKDLDLLIKKLENPLRDDWQKPERVLRSLALSVGDQVADIGAGSGYFTLRLAEAVGKAGTVYAVDKEQGMLDFIQKKLDKQKSKEKEEQQELPVKLSLAHPGDPGLEPASCNLVFICNMYHHLYDKVDYLQAVRKLLKKQGRMAIIDFKKADTPFGPSPVMRVAADELVQQAEEAGFTLQKKILYLPFQNFLIFTVSTK